MTHRLDDIDRRIISLLLEDGRMPSAEIARRIGHVSERTVRYRIDRLVNNGVIQVSAVVNPRALGLAVTADVFIEVVPGRLRSVAQSLAQLPQVSYVAYSTGERDLSIQVYARDNAELHTFVSEVIGNIPGVARTSTMLVPWKVKDVHQWHVPEELPYAGDRRRSTSNRGGHT
ncbi:MAG: Lrp/AsnC family transcriptional regulator [Actinobacteria bacterium]|nr:Lrp/AsnC family transcriptional regulator [Actinomycetota bacterium]